MATTSVQCSNILLKLGKESILVPTPKTLGELVKKATELFPGKLPAQFAFSFPGKAPEAPTLIRTESDYASFIKVKKDAVVLTIEPLSSSPHEQGRGDEILISTFEVVDKKALEKSIDDEKEKPGQSKKGGDEAVQTKNIITAETGTDAKPGTATRNESSNTEKVVMVDSSAGAKPETNEKCSQFELMENAEVPIACPMCKGKNSKGSSAPQCKYCNNTGLQSEELKKVLKEMLEKELSAALQEGSAEIVHSPDVKCNSCGMCPIKGIRYKCQSCPAFNLCAICEHKADVHEHAMLKIRKMGQKGWDNSVAVVVAKADSGLSAKLISESSLIGASNLGPGEVIEKIWTFKNDGKAAWPADTVFKQATGENLSGNKEKLGAVRPGSLIDVKMKLKVPEKPGTYSVTFGIFCGAPEKGKELTFGPKGLLDFTVQFPKKSAKPTPAVAPLSQSSLEERRQVDLAKKLTTVKYAKEHEAGFIQLLQIFESQNPQELYRMLVQAKGQVQAVVEMLTSSGALTK